MSIKRQGYSLILTKGHSDFEIKTCFSLNAMPFETKFHMKAYGRMGMKNYTNKMGHMAKITAMYLYGK